MIEEIAIRDLGVIGDAKLVFSKGLTAITGETGAGKTMVLSALGLLLGNRAEASAVRAGAEQAFVEGRWYLANGPSKAVAAESGQASGVRQAVAQVLDEAGIPFDGTEVILNRSVSAEGRSKAAANGRAIPVAAVADLGAELVVVHGQSDQIRLKSAKAQRDALDSFGGLPLTSLRTEYEQTFKQFEALRERHANLTASSDARSGRISLLRSWIAEIERVAPKAGELADVSSKIEKLSNLESLREGVSGAHEALSNTGYSDQVDAIGLLGLARKSLEGASGKDAQLGEFAERLRDIGSQLNDLAAEFSGYLTDLEGDGEESLEWLQERKSVLVGLARLHSVSPDELDGLLGRYSDELLEIDNSDEAIASSLAELAEASTKAERLAGELSAARHSAAQELETAVTAELAGLAMPNARVIVEVTALPELRGHGRDEVAFLLASFSGAQPRPISKGASGGELSRIMLALEVVLAKGVQAPTFIFDEVDAGVGGEAAIEVGRRLARLAQTAQVIVVTHLAQVAAFADRQLRVLKSHEGDVTSSDVVALEGEPRVAELARMISGMADSEAARKNAQELLSLARLSV